MSATSKVPLTKRGMVSVVYSLFDPLGFIAPYIMKAKLLLQTLNRKGIGWDAPVKDAECLQWERWIDDLDKLREVLSQKDLGKFKKPSCICSQMPCAKDIQLLPTSV